MTNHATQILRCRQYHNGCIAGFPTADGAAVARRPGSHRRWLCAGRHTDILTRVIAQKLSVMWGTAIVVENKAGATGMIAADYVAKQPADGTTLLMAHINSHAIGPALMPHITYNVERDFTPLVLVGITPKLLICN